MKITRKSPKTGALNTRDIPITPDQLEAWEKGGALIQDVMPEVSIDDREFLMTGMTPEDWDSTFGGDDE